MNSADNTFRKYFDTEQQKSIVLVTIFLLIGLPLANYFDLFWRYFLCLPSAKICSIFLGSDCIATSEGYMLTNELLAIHVTSMCSASSFFVLLIAMISGAVIGTMCFKDSIKVLWIIPLAYLITITANSARILGGWVTGRWARSALPENLWSGVHLGTGVVVFLTFLIATYLLLKWRPFNG